VLKRGKNLKIALLLVGVYATFLTVLLTGISSAKYQETRVAYTNFGAASFNTVVLGSTAEETKAGNYRVFNVFENPLQVSHVSGYRPGMTYSEDVNRNTAKEIKFSVANGVTWENASDASVQYEISLRTTNHLPLKYTLHYNGKSYEAGEKTRLEPETSIGTVWYEQKFYETVGEGEREASFDLEGGRLNVNDYALVVEWPVENNDVKYMKEVELLELFVTVSSKNMLEDPDYGNGVTIQTEPGTGIIILNPDKGQSFIHTVDYRAFATEEGKTFYNFLIENGVGKQIKHTKVNTSYTFEIEVPWTTATQSFQYELQDADGNRINTTEAGYRLYDVLYSHERYNGNGGYVRKFEEKAGPAAADIETWSASDSQYKLYKVLCVSGETVLENTLHDEREYRLVLTGDGTNNISGATAFDNKIEILVAADYIGNTLPDPLIEEGGAESD